MEALIDPSVPATEKEILIDKDTVAGIKIKPWTISKCSEVTPFLERIYIELKKRHLTFKDFFIIEPSPEGKEKITVMNLDQLFFTIMPFSADIIKTTLSLTTEELDKVSPEEAHTIIATILRQNIGYIKNSFALIRMSVQTLAKKS